jgi:hypothetical protein
MPCAAAQALSAALTGCASMVPAGPLVRAELKPTASSAAAGRVEFADGDSAVRVTAEMRALKPNAGHGL